MYVTENDWIDRFLNISNKSAITFREYGSLRLIARILLWGTLAILFLLTFNLIKGVEKIPYLLYSIYFIISTIAILFLRAGSYTIAKVIYIIGLVGFLFAFAVTAPYRAGTHIYFVLLILIMLAMINEGKHKILFPVLFLIFIAYMLSSFPGFDPFERREFSSELIQSYFIINMVIFFSMTYFVLWWIMDLHKKYEKELKERADQLTKQKEQLEETNKNMDRVVYTVTHDLRAPLNSMQGLLNLAESASPEDLAQYNDMMKKQIVSMKAFIQDIVEYNRNAKTQVEAEPVILMTLIEEVIDSFKSTIDNSIEFEVFGPTHVALKSDPIRVKVILSNLIGNSIKYRDRQKSKTLIKIQVAKLENFIQITIADNGMGIQRDHLDKIFDMFYRATIEQEGTGLGLFIVKETVEKLGGTISVSSDPGKGTLFQFTLPA